MPKEFKYDVLQMIQCVKDRPCLWDKTLENYKDRIERRTAWEEIFGIMDDGYEAMSWEEKRLTGELILNKWTNIRDTFVKSLRTKMGKPKKKYQLYEYLKFLLKIAPDDEYSVEFNTTEVPTTYIKQVKTEDSVRSYYSRKRTQSVPTDDANCDDNEDTYNTPKKSKKANVSHKSRSQEGKDYDSSNDNIDFVEVNESDPRIMNEDEAFFASLLPTVANYSEDDRLEFRMEVLGVMKKIREKTKWPGYN